MLDYTSLSALAAVVREGSFERAAQALHVTASAVSQRIKQLEERVGCALVVRGQPAQATQAGHALCRHAEQVGLLEYDLRQRLPASAQLGFGVGGAAPRPTLRIAVNADSLATWFMVALSEFVHTVDDEGRDEALIDVVVDDQDHTADWLRRGEVLAAVTANARPVPGCRAVHLGSLVYAATASPAFVARYFANGVDAQALRRAPSLRFNQKDTLQGRWARSVWRQSVDMPTHGLPSASAFVDACLTGVGWGMNPIVLVESHLQSGRLVELVPGRRLETPLVWQQSRLSAPLLQRLAAVVVTVARRSLDAAAGSAA